MAEYAEISLFFKGLYDTKNNSKHFLFYALLAFALRALLLPLLGTLREHRTANSALTANTL